MGEILDRQSIRLRGYDYSQPGLYFITVCTQNRRCIFGHIVGAGSSRPVMVLNEAGKTAEGWWNKIPSKYPDVELDAYQTMPNHIHAIVNIVGAGYSRPQSGYSHPTLGQIVAFYKYQSTKSINEMGAGTGGDLPAQETGAKTAPLRAENKYPKIWQRNYFEQIIRNETDLEKIRGYVRLNPEMWARDRNNPSLF